MRQEPEKIINEVRKAIVGKDEVLEKVLTALLADGHLLLDDAPGTGKTTLALAFSRAISLSFGRIQFTPDVLPSDIVGFTIYDKASGSFVYRSGAMTGTNLLLADEINRTPSRTQSALLEAMEERQVTVDGTTYPLEKPFLVIATQNRVGAAGTQLLPYAQMDRFLMRLSIGHPDEKALFMLLRDRQGRNPLDDVSPVMDKAAFLDAQKQVQTVFTHDSVLEYISRLVVASRQDDMIETGISPRGALFLDRAAKAHAWIGGRDYVTPADVQAVFIDVCAHRIILRRGAGSPAAVLADILSSTPSPDLRG